MSARRRRVLLTESRYRAVGRFFTRMRAAPDRVAVYGIENHASTPIYVQAKTCLIDHTWASIASDNFNRRS